MKIPKAAHLIGSHAAKRDQKLDVFQTDGFLAERLVYQEKLDGFNVSIAFDAAGNLSIKHLGKPLVAGGRAFAIKKWAKSKEAMLLNYLGDGFALLGEWMRERQDVFYDNLPSPFIACDVYDKQNDAYLCAERLDQLCSVTDIQTVPTIMTGVFGIGDVVRWATAASSFGREQREGVYVRFEDEFRVIERAQYIGERVESPHKTKINLVRSSDA